MSLLLPLIESLVTDSKAVALKKETEAEGSASEDLLLFRGLSWRASLPLYVKIGGAEAISDVKLCRRVDADGIIAPMIESPFALQKFLSAVEAVYGNAPPRLIVTIESQTAVSQFDAILKLARGRIDEMTIGRTDLSASYADPAITPASAFITGIMADIARRIEGSGMALNIGGAIDTATPAQLKNHPELMRNIRHVETRNVICGSGVTAEMIAAALRFEQAYLRCRNAIETQLLSLDRQRLEKLSGRLK